MWQNTDFENYLKNALNECFTDQKAEEYYSYYSTAKVYLCKNIYSQIPGREPELTDHTETHIENVLNMAWRLISDEKGESTDFNAIESLLLCVCILFHDVGNIHGRENHNRHVGEIYNQARATFRFTCQQERNLLLKIVAAHCGKTKTGSKDTLLDLPESSNLFDKKIRLRELAAILRFADELAEGPQRTSQYMIEKGMISEKSIIFHKYAEITDVYLDKGNNRVVLTYNIDYPVNDVSLEELLKFVYKRILKMDAERRYCKYYAPTLRDILKTEASINFTINGDICDFDMPKICLEDKYSIVDEDEDINLIINNKPEFKIESIEKRLQELINNSNN